MRNSIVLFAAAGVIALGGAAQAQVLGGGVGGGLGGGLGTPVGGVTGGATGGATGRITAPDLPTDRVTGAARDGVDTTRRAAKKAKGKAVDGVDRARDAAVAATDSSARAAASFAAGTSVQDSSGAVVGKVVGTDASGAVRIRTKSGVVQVPSASLRMSGDAAVSSQSEAEIRASGSARAN